MKVLVLLVDALRADHLGCYGYGYDTSPRLDEMASHGVRFARFFAPSIPTEPAHTCIFTGQHSVTHGVVAHKAGHVELPGETPWWPQLLRQSGVLTAAIDTLADQAPWFARGWAEYHNPRRPGQLIDATVVNEALLQWLDAHRDGDWLCFAHYWDVHSPYLPPSPLDTVHDAPGIVGAPGLELWEAQPSYPFARRWQVASYGEVRDLEQIRARYDGAITFLDQAIGEVLDQLRRIGCDRDTVVMVTADHGEVMYDRPGFFDHAGLYDDTVHVPLIVSGPGLRPGGVCSGTHQHVDLAPTILGLFGVPTPENLAGRDLGPVLRGDEVPADEALYLTEATWEVKWGVRTDEWKLIKVLDPGVHGMKADELYHLPSDPGEETNVVDRYPDVADALELRLRRWWEAGLASGSDPLREQLRRGVPAAQWVADAVAAEALTQDEWRASRYHLARSTAGASRSFTRPLNSSS